MQTTWETFKRDLLAPRKLKIGASFHCDPAISVRFATAADRKCRTFHSHTDINEILLVLDGECEFIIGDRVYRGGAGTALFIESGTKHESYYPATAPAGRHLWILVMPNYLAYNLFQTDGRCCERDPVLQGFHHYDPLFQPMFNRALGNAVGSGGDEVSIRELELLIQLRATQIVNIREEAARFGAYGTEKHGQLIVKRAKEYIDQQCGKNCSIDLLAQMAGYSRSNFIRLFRKHAECSVLEYINRARIVRCKSMSPRTPLKMFAQALGFSSASAFLHWRKQNADRLQPADWGALTRPSP